MSLRLWVLLGVVTFLTNCSGESPEVQTNFIIVWVDDMGFSDRTMVYPQPEVPERMKNNKQ